MSGKEYIKKLLLNGWKIDRIKGSHHIIKKGTLTVSVPVHGNKDLKPGTLSNLYKTTGIK